MAVYPEDCIQSFVSPWWTTDATNDLRVGRLVRAYIPHVEQESLAIRVNGRTMPTNHTSVDISVVPLSATAPPPAPAIPVAGFPHYGGEVYMVQRAKLRPAIVVSVEPPLVQFPKGSPPWQSFQTVYVAPAYGCDQSGSRGGWDRGIMGRIKTCMYPQYMLDKLPLAGAEWSVVRFDQIQPISRSHSSFVVTEHCLSEDAVDVIHDWVSWIHTGEVADGGYIDVFQTDMADRAARATKPAGQ